MKDFIIQNIIAIICFIFIVITLIFTIKNNEQLKFIVNNNNSIQKIENSKKANKNNKSHYYLFAGIFLLLALLLFIVPYTYKKVNEIKLQKSQLQRLEKIDEYLLIIDQKLFISEENYEELLSLHKELVFERENITKKGRNED